jgi:hypothetical protein
VIITVNLSSHDSKVSGPGWDAIRIRHAFIP